MTEQAIAQVAKQLADLRLQVNALQIVAKNGSLPEMLKQTRRTIWLSALLVAVALLVSGYLHMRGDSRTRALEQRIERLEHDKKGG